MFLLAVKSSRINAKKITTSAFDVVLRISCVCRGVKLPNPSDRQINIHITASRLRTMSTGTFKIDLMGVAHPGAEPSRFLNFVLIDVTFSKKRGIKSTDTEQSNQSPR